MACEVKISFQIDLQYAVPLFFGHFPGHAVPIHSGVIHENLEIAERDHTGGEKWDKQKVYDLFPALKDLDSRKGGLLSGGEQKMLAIGRALMTNPQFLLLDEPTEGLAPVLVKSLGERIKTLKAFGLTVLLAEQNVKFTLTLSDYGYIIDNGRICYQGPVDELIDNDEVRRICGI